MSVPSRSASPEKYPSLTRAESLDACPDGADVVVLCTKPQNCDAVFADLRPVVQNQKTPPVLLSILAGVPTERFRAGLGLQKVARAMPNTPGQIGCGVTVWTAGEHKELIHRGRYRAVQGRAQRAGQGHLCRRKKVPTSTCPRLYLVPARHIFSY